MTNFMYTEAKRLLQIGDINWLSAGGDTIKLRLLKTGSTAGTTRNANTFADIGTMGTHDYSTPGDLLVPTRTVAEDLALFVAIAHAGNVTFPSVPAAGSGAVPIAVLFYKDTGTESTCIPIAYCDQGISGAAANGSDITYRPSASGVFYF